MVIWLGRIIAAHQQRRGAVEEHLYPQFYFFPSACFWPGDEITSNHLTPMASLFFFFFFWCALLTKLGAADFVTQWAMYVVARFQDTTCLRVTR